MTFIQTAVARQASTETERPAWTSLPTEGRTTFLVITSLLFRRKLLAPYKRDVRTTCWETPNSQGHTKMGTEHNQWLRWGEAMHRRFGFSAPITSTPTDLSNFVKCHFAGVTCWSLHTGSSLRAQIQHLPAGFQSNKQFLLTGRRTHCWVGHFFWLRLHVAVENLQPAEKSPHSSQVSKKVSAQLFDFPCQSKAL